MGGSTIALIASLVVNLMQYISAWHKQNQDHDIKDKRIHLEAQHHKDEVDIEKAKIKLEKQKQIENHEHEISIKKLDNSIYVQKTLLPKIQKVFTDYIEITTAELSNNDNFNGFSNDQHHKEMLVRLYCPNIGEQIDLLNNPGFPGKGNSTSDAMLYILDNNVIPAMTKYMQQLPR